MANLYIDHDQLSIWLLLPYNTVCMEHLLRWSQAHWAPLQDPAITRMPTQQPPNSQGYQIRGPGGQPHPSTLSRLPVCPAAMGAAASLLNGIAGSGHMHHAPTIKRACLSSTTSTICVLVLCCPRGPNRAYLISII